MLHPTVVRLLLWRKPILQTLASYSCPSAVMRKTHFAKTCILQLSLWCYEEDPFSVLKKGYGNDEGKKCEYLDLSIICHTFCMLHIHHLYGRHRITKLCNSKFPQRFSQGQQFLKNQELISFIKNCCLDCNSRSPKTKTKQNKTTTNKQFKERRAHKGRYPIMHLERKIEKQTLKQKCFKKKYCRKQSAQRQRETILTSSMKACNLERRLVCMIIRSRHLLRILFNGFS